MLRITIELIPYGFGKAKRIGMMDIFNDGTGTKQVGNYGWCLYSKDGRKITKKGRVIGYKRLNWGVWRLVRLVLEEIYGNKKNTDNLRRAEGD